MVFTKEWWLIRAVRSVVQETHRAESNTAIHRRRLGISARSGALIVLILSGCAELQNSALSASATCAGGETLMTRSVLYFGRSRAHGGLVTAEEWQQFVAEIVVPRFPQGFTVTGGRGHWRDAHGKAVDEASTMLTVLHVPAPQAAQAIAEIRTSYRTRFQQTSVLYEHTNTCVSF